MIRYLLLMLLIACGPKHIFGKDYVTESESPCVDGTIVNIDQAGCESFYWGTSDNMAVLKIRCAYAEEDNFWTTSSFWAVPHGAEVPFQWVLYCQDRYVCVYTTAAGILQEED